MQRNLPLGILGWQVSSISIFQSNATSKIAVRWQLAADDLLQQNSKEATTEH